MDQYSISSFSSSDNWVNDFLFWVLGSYVGQITKESIHLYERSRIQILFIRVGGPAQLELLPGRNISGNYGLPDTRITDPVGGSCPDAWKRRWSKKKRGIYSILFIPVCMVYGHYDRPICDMEFLWLKLYFDYSILLGISILSLIFNNRFAFKLLRNQI